MSRILDKSRAAEIADEVIGQMEYDGQLLVDEILPGLAEAILRLSKQTSNPTQVIDEVIDMLTEEGEA